MVYRLVAILNFTLFILALNAQETPKIISFSPSDYGALNQNWSITEGCDHKIYIANTAGVLIFNGLRWKMATLPEGIRPRSVFKGKDCRIYVTGYETFGYIDLQNPEHPIYKPVADSLLHQRNQEYWKIFGDTSQIIFQSFSEVYSFDYNEIKSLSTPTNIMLGTSVDNELILPKIESGVYNINNDVITEVVRELSLPEGSKVIGVASGGIYATQNNGLFKLTEQGYLPIGTELNAQLKEDQINCILKTTEGLYIIGTILNGIYITENLETVKYHLNKANGLSNNTVLSLFEDENGNLWCGLDKGIDLIKLKIPLLYYYDKQGELGSVFTSIIYKNQLYLGTNQGAFRKNKDGHFTLIEGSQGQVWSFLEIDGDLICGHNKGSFLIEGDKFQPISSITGGWCMRKISENKFLQSSYTGLILFEKVLGQWGSGTRIRDGEYLMENFELLDTVIVGYHPHYGVTKTVLNADFSTVLQHITVRKISAIDPLILSTEDAFIILAKEDSIYIGIESAKKKPANSFLQNFAPALKVVKDYEQITNIRFANSKSENHTTIVGFNEGYVVIPQDLLLPRQEKIILDYVLINNELNVRPIQKSLLLDPHENDINLQFRSTSFSQLGNDLNYKLHGWDDEWFPLPSDGFLTFNNLDDGNYHLEFSNGEIPIVFEIEPRWYESWPGLLLYMSMGLLTILFFNKRQNRKLKKQRKKLEAEKEKELESQRIRAKNTELENEVLYKNKMLANSTMTLVQKNQMLIDLKSTLAKEMKAEPEKRRQVLHLIEKSINSDDDWELFEHTFAEVHDDFLEKLKATHPKITNGELRLAAYIKMDLSSKEIAPLMNISVRSIENKRYRLRKKLKVEESLKGYLQGM